MSRSLDDLLRKTLPKPRLDLIHRVADEASRLGFPIYIVGGFVRDLLLSRPVNDFDIVIEGDAIKLARALTKADGGKVTTHPKFGTASWTFEDSAIDLITARSETYQHPGALPTVKFSTIDDDLRRRDFTINAMALRLDGDHFGELLDPLNGQEDLKAQRVRVLHSRSFVDDPTRMLRSVRYALRYGFKISPDTLKLIGDESRAVLKRLSGERLRHEFDLIFEEDKPSEILAKLAELDLLKSVHLLLSKLSPQLPSIFEPQAEWGEFKSANILSVRQMLGWLLWLAPLDKDEVESVSTRLVFPAALTKSVHAASALFAALPTLSFTKPSQWTFYLDDFPKLSVYAAYLKSNRSELKGYLSKWQFIRPLITGDDLNVRGVKPGPEYQKILSRLRAAWLDGDIRTQEQEMILLDNFLMEK